LPLEIVLAGGLYVNLTVGEGGFVPWRLSRFGCQMMRLVMPWVIGG
jgi:hypothetical protein